MGPTCRCGVSNGSKGQTVAMRAKVIMVTLVLVLASCAHDGREQVAIMEASSDDNLLDMAVASCNASPSAEVDESDERVVVTVTADRRGPNGDDCADGITVRLSDSLGSRSLIDGPSGERVQVRVAAVAATPPASDVEQVCQRFLPIYMNFAAAGGEEWSLDAVYGALYALNGTYPGSGLRAMSVTVEGTLTEGDVVGMATECEERSSVDFPRP